MKALWIQWVDAKSWSNDWMGCEDTFMFTLPVCESRGVVIKEDKDSIFLAQTVSEGDHRNIIGIPKACIQKQKKIP